MDFETKLYEAMDRMSKTQTYLEMVGIDCDAERLSELLFQYEADIDDGKPYKLYTFQNYKLVPVNEDMLRRTMMTRSMTQTMRNKGGRRRTIKRQRKHRKNKSKKY